MHVFVIQRNVQILLGTHKYASQFVAGCPKAPVVYALPSPKSVRQNTKYECIPLHFTRLSISVPAFLHVGKHLEYKLYYRLDIIFTLLCMF